MNEVASCRNISTTCFPFVRPSPQSTKIVKNQTNAGRLQAAKNKKKVQDALHDTDATDDEVEVQSKTARPKQVLGLHPY
jgi:hypothetical protein